MAQLDGHLLTQAIMGDRGENDSEDEMDMGLLESNGQALDLDGALL